MRSLSNLNNRTEPSVGVRVTNVLGALAFMAMPAYAEDGRALKLEACGVSASAYLESEKGLRTVTHLVKMFSEKVAAGCSTLKIENEEIPLQPFVEGIECETFPNWDNSWLGEWEETVKDPGCVARLPQALDFLVDDFTPMERVGGNVQRGETLTAWNQQSNSFVSLKVTAVYPELIFLAPTEGMICDGDSGGFVKRAGADTVLGDISLIYGPNKTMVNGLPCVKAGAEDNTGIIAARPGQAAAVTVAAN